MVVDQLYADALAEIGRLRAEARRGVALQYAEDQLRSREDWLARVADRLGLMLRDDPWDEVERRIDETLVLLTAELGDLAERFDKQGAHFVRLTNEVVDLRAERDTLAARLAEAEKVRDDVLALARYCELGARDDVYLAATRVLHAYRSTRAETTDG